MATRRSLNKLERKAHMSIHNTVEVTEEAAENTGNTRDRFGKRHVVSRTKRLDGVDLLAKSVVLFALGAGLCQTPLVKAAEPVLPSTVRRSTHVTIDSSQLEPFSLNKKTEPETKRSTSNRDDSLNLNFNEDSGPNVGMRF